MNEVVRFAGSENFVGEWEEFSGQCVH